MAACSTRLLEPLLRLFMLLVLLVSAVHAETPWDAEILAWHMERVPQSSARSVANELLERYSFTAVADEMFDSAQPANGAQLPNFGLSNGTWAGVMEVVDEQRERRKLVHCIRHAEVREA